MSKWNKQAPQLSQQFIQNEERRKQMIIQAGRRRRQMEKKQSEAQKQQLKSTQQALTKHKAQKKDAYLRYLRNNMHDKHQQAQRQQKQQHAIESRSKWKKRTPSQDSNEHLQALDLEVHMKEEKPKGQKDKITKQFQKEWNDDFQEDWKNDQNQLLGSQLLDSLDLDFGSINRQKEVKKMMKDQRLKQQQPQKITNQAPQFKDQLKRLKELIGYESIVVGEQPPPKEVPSVPVPQKKIKQKQPQKKAEPQGNQVETFNQLRRKKEGKIMNWAIEEEQEAQDLFSNCSSRRKQNVALRQLNEQLKNKKPHMSANHLQGPGNLEIIDQQTKKDKKGDLRSNVVRRTIQAKPEARGTSKSVEKAQAKTTTTAFTKKKAQQARTVQPQRTVSNSFQRNKSREERKQSIGKRTAQNKVTSVESAKKNQPVAKIEHKEQRKKLGGNIPPLPIRYDNNSIATHDMQIDVQSFIRQDLIGLNQHERQLQAELRDLHNNHKGDIKQIFQKYQIKTDYQHSAQIAGQPCRQGYTRPTEADIQQSLENLDHLLIRRQIQSREKKTTEEEQVNSDSFINPFSNSDDLCQQVLQLAKNVSRFEKEAEEPVPNGYLQKAGRGKKQESYIGKQTYQAGKKETDSISKYSRNKEDEANILGESECESEQVSQVPLGMPPVIGSSQKIHVNRQLLRGLLDDD